MEIKAAMNTIDFGLRVVASNSNGKCMPHSIGFSTKAATAARPTRAKHAVACMAKTQSELREQT